MSKDLTTLKGKKILIVGFGKSGIAAAGTMLGLGADVTIQDAKQENEVDRNTVTYFRGHGAKFCFGKTPDDPGAFEMLILSPGVSPELPFVRKAEEAGAEIVGELEIAYRISEGSFVSITGTNGKTTTTTLVGEIFKNSGRSTMVAGNIGTAVVSKSAGAKPEDWLIVEASSFQLETTKRFRPHVSAILNITPDHLNRHHTFEAYAKAKAKIFANQGPEDFFVTNYEDETCRKLAETCRAQVVWFSSARELETGAFVKDGRLVFRGKDGKLFTICEREDLRIIGDHNVQNALAAAAISLCAGIGPDIIGETIRNFAGVEHRIEYCACINGVDYYNDSKGTNVDASVTALRAIGDHIVLIAGGDAKGQDFTEFAKEFPARVKKLILFGRDAGRIREAADAAGFTNYVTCRDLEECVRNAFDSASAGDTVLLSPACASWDMYANYEQRGRHFKDCVRRLES